jgi:hypothetical protein
MSKSPIAVIISTFNRTDDARINMEIIREIWQKDPNLANIKIVHAYNGDEAWWPEKYLDSKTLVISLVRPS